MKGHFLWGAVAAVAIASSAADAGISGGAFTTSSSVAPVLLGPVEAVKESQGVVIVLGQKLPLQLVGAVEVGQIVAIFGNAKPDGSFDITGVQRQGLYTAGATQIVLTGVVQKVIASLGRATVNGVNVDLTSVSSASGGVGVGSLVQVAGIQPVSGGLVLAEGISGGAKLSGISGGASTTSGISGGASTLSGISGGAK